MARLPILALAGFLVLAIAGVLRNAPSLAPGMYNWAEPGNVAAALVQGRGFSDPFDGGTGPTAWVSPLPVWVEAAVFLALGVKSAASAGALLVLAVLGLAWANALLLSALAPYGPWARAAASAAFLAYCTLVPSGPLEVLSEAWLDILLSMALLWSALQAARTPSVRGRLALLAVAVAAPLDNAGLAVATGLVVAGLAWSHWPAAGALRLPMAAAALAAASVGAWTARNFAAFHRIVPLKSNGWFELHLANVDSDDGLPRMATVLRKLPFFDIAEFERYARLGEIAYVESYKAPTLAALRADPGHFIGNILRRAGDALVFCRREGGGAATRLHLRQEDAVRLVASGDLILLGQSGSGLWARIDADPAEMSARLHAMHLVDEGAVWRDWAEKRLAFDAAYRGPAAIVTGFLTAGVPVAALLFCALLAGGWPPSPAAWATLIGFGMLLPFVLVNHNERHQLPLVGLQAVAIGSLVQAGAARIRRRAA